MRVLIVTHSEDNESVDLVGRALEARGSEVVRLDTDTFPTISNLRLELNRTGERIGFTNQDGESWELSDLSAVWYRRLRTADLPAMDPQIAQASTNEAKATLLSLLGVLDLNAFVLDPPYRMRFSEHKGLQLKLAASLGLSTPETLITNSPAEVRRFFKAHQGQVVTKMLSSFAIYDAEHENAVFTSRLTEEHLEDLSGLRYCPMVFQKMIPKALELRVTIVGNRIFSAAVNSQVSSEARYDWRQDGAGLIDAWEPYELPEKVKTKLLALMDHLGLNYGAADIILTPGGEYVFLELNPAGEFFWLELNPGLPISGALADVLTGRASRRNPKNVGLINV